MVSAVLDRRLIFVTGKGGVGKTTVARALGLDASGRGKRVIVAELAAGAEGHRLDEVELAPGLFSITIDSHAAMEEYLRVKAGAVGGALSHSRLFSTLAMATPGLRELLAMGKIWELAQFERRTRGADAYDLVVVDAPATGHGVAALRTPAVFAQTARVGPIAHQASTIAATIADRAFTAIVGVAIPEEMSVRETLSLSASLGADGLELDAVVLNGRYPERFSDEEAARMSEVLQGGPTPPSASPAEAALRAALSHHARAAAQRPHAERLAEFFGERLITLPYRFTDTVEPADLTEPLGEALG